MNGVYQIYKRDSVTGAREKLIQRYTTFTLTLNWGQESKFSIKGETISDIELETGNGILFYRNNELVFAGVVESMTISCDNEASGKKEWTATGKDDNVIFSYRQILPDPEEITFNENIVDKIGEPDEETGEYGIDAYAYNRILYYIFRNMGEGTIEDRRVPGLIFPGTRSRGTQAMSAYRFKTLAEAIKEIGGEKDDEGKENGMYPQYFWNPENGTKSIIIPYEQRDMTEKVTLSPEFGNVTAWSKTTKMPKFNSLWVCSGTYEVDQENEETHEIEKVKTRIWVYAEDEDSIAQFGRIEKVLTKSDIKVVEDNPETEEEDETVTAEQVNLLLRKEAKKQLEDNSYKKKYTITMVETPELRFWDDWKCGDLVTCVIDGEKFTSTIKTVTITYKNGIESVKPTVGEIELGEFADLFQWITGIDQRLSEEELSSE